MFSVLIVDDEAIIRDGISKMMPWESLGVNAVQTAASGRQAVALLEKSRVDLMITDICMVNMDGLELISSANTTNPDMRIIVLTGYNSFEYSQQCCKMAVHDYLLKPIDEHELELAISKQLNALRMMENCRVKQNILMRARGHGEQLRFESELRAILQSGEDAEQIERLLSEAGYRTNAPIQAAVLLPRIGAEKGERELDAMRYATAKSVCMEIFDMQDLGITLEDAEGRIVLLIFADPHTADVEESLLRLQSVLRSEVGVGYRVLLGNRVPSLPQAHLSYHDALTALQSARASQRYILRAEKAELQYREFSNLQSQWMDRLEENLTDEAEFSRIFDGWADFLRGSGCEDALARKSAYTLATRLYYRYTSDEGGASGCSPEDMLSAIRNSGLEDMIIISLQYFRKAYFQDQPHGHETIRTVIRYIEDHLSEDISVASIADKHFMSVPYLSRLFKKKTGEGCNEYISRRRIETACEMLEHTTLPSGKIGGMVGYRDMNYFSLVFKRSTGFSPTEYRSERQRNH